jgi:hypothetical protein
MIGGVKYTWHNYNMTENDLNEDYNRFEKVIDMNKTAGDVQGYLSWKYRMNDDITWVGGFHAMYFSLNKDYSFEPRIALKWQITPKQSINAGFGQHSKTESIISYYANVYAPDGSFTTPNKNLGIAKARHYILGHEYRISKNLNSKLEFYYQDLYNIPVENIDTSSFTILNSDEGYVSKSLSNHGTGTNVGIEYTLERYFSQNFYFLLTASVYDSKYKAREGKLRNTKYNGNFAVNFLAGKEFKVGKSNAIGVNIKLFFNGGRRYIPVDLNASKAKDETVYDYSQAWVNKLDDVKQVNFSMNYRVNRPKTSHEFIVDVMNLTNEKARNWEYYNKYTGKLDYHRQLNIIPNIMYRIHF